MKFYKTKKKNLRIQSEQHLIEILNKIRNNVTILGIKGFFCLNDIKNLLSENSYKILYP